MATKQEINVRDRLIVALDVSTLDEARSLIEELREHAGMFKAGLELFTSAGLKLFELMKEEGVRLFFDGKFHDIPNTAARAARNATLNGCAMFNVHATGGSTMMKAARRASLEAASELGIDHPILIAVTVLTSIDQHCLKEELAVERAMMDQVVALARLTQSAGLDGVVASAQEAKAIRQATSEGFRIVTPGVRPAWSSSDDQARIVTPKDALAEGSDYLVIGRPITGAADRKDAARRILEEMESALS